MVASRRRGRLVSCRLPKATSTFSTYSWISAGYRLRAFASTLSTSIADRAQSWSPAPAQHWALLDRRVFERQTVRRSRPGSSSLYCMASRGNDVRMTSVQAWSSDSRLRSPNHQEWPENRVAAVMTSALIGPWQGAALPSKGHRRPSESYSPDSSRRNEWSRTCQ